MLHRVGHISTSTVHGRLPKSGLHDQIAAKKPLLKYTSKKKRLAWAKKLKQWTLDWWKSVLWSDESKCEIFGSNRRVFVRRRVGEQMISACVVPTVKQGGGVMVLCWWHHLIYLEFKAHLTSMANTAIRHPIWFALIRSIICTTGQWPRTCKGYLTKERDGVLH